MAVDIAAARVSVRKEKRAEESGLEGERRRRVKKTSSKLKKSLCQSKPFCKSPLCHILCTQVSTIVNKSA